MITLEITALGPLLFRDARPFSGSHDETRASSLAFPWPSTIASMVRGVIARQRRKNLKDAKVLDDLAGIHVKGYWFELDGKPVFAAPANSLVVGKNPSNPQVSRLVPFELPDGWGCDMPDGLLPVHVEGAGGQDTESKPLRGYDLWPAVNTFHWLKGENDSPIGIEPPVVDQRVQIQLDPRTRAAADGKLFTVVYRDWDQIDTKELKHWRLIVEVEEAEREGVPEIAVGTRRLAHFGGERGQVGVTWGASTFPAPRKELREKITSSKELVMQLATPAVFNHGWKAYWMDKPERLDPALEDAELVSACVNRPEAVSGWSLDPRSFGPKATKLAAPAGSTYFFRLKRRLDDKALCRLWCKTVSDQQNDNNDGFGLALWGVWN
ncbi:MAG: type III-B CRISPR module-associated protein Cmr3 [Acidipropionibacterium sp.]|jgi:CRISPR-associated protein Cmr3|nr:type III-B CRISPR module-associated protein Cmr3 [Acidipropionibacterium sp.]